ncbi:hypothetical protein [Roseivirga sp. E12]|uniref:hypothetical protein n=1 Tax=Roseivirga sp. E12 TaxID=2819237 RepID=UPI001ABCA4F6|nr:hypothetical protein [Roseivirga sp. E12]MBO3697687.1 hypothetical protein [Roseivirga sp. E12]
MRGLNKLVLAISVLLLAASCNKKDVPQKNYFFTFNVKIGKRVTEPTIINGYYGTMNLYKGDFSATDSANVKQPVPARFEILLFETSKKEAIDAASYIENGKVFYNLKQIKKADVKPKFIITPNKSGFYQFDPNDADYLALICVNKRTGYYPSGLGTLPSPGGVTRKLDMRVDYQATF